MNDRTVREHIVAVGSRCRPLGLLRFGRLRNKQVSSFRYLPEWLEDTQAFPIAPSLPLNEQTHHFSSSPDNASACLPGIISDTAPDAWGRAIMQRAAGRGLDELDYLISVDDRTRPGALRFLDNNAVPLANDTPPIPRLVDLPRLRRLCANLQSGTGDLRLIALELRGASASLGGARPKSVVVDERGAFYVAKFTMSQDTMPIERVEVATLALAHDVGVRAARARLAMPKTNSPVALIERFDRHEDDGPKRIHYMSAQTLVDAPRGERRFYTDIADGLRAVCRTGERALAELEELHRRILFTILVSNNDDHLKNHGLLYVGDDSWALSPAFDINPQPFRDRHLKTGISELSGFEASVEAWVEAAPFFEVSEDAARERAAAMSRQITDRWRGRLLENGVTEAQCDEYAAAFEHDQMTVALCMGDGSIALNHAESPRTRKEFRRFKPSPLSPQKDPGSG